MGKKGGTHIVSTNRDGRPVLIVKVPSARQHTVYVDRHPSPEAAMEEAVRCRNILRVGGNLDDKPKQSRRCTGRPQGFPPPIAGVRRIPADFMQIEGARWIAQWPSAVKNKVKTRSFYVSRFGELGACLRAEEALRKRITKDGRKRD